jgi:putative N6-adenine-specific DNA methylase
VYIKIAEFQATTFDALYENTRQIEWHHWIRPTDQFPVSKITSRKSALFSKSDTQAIVKKAVVDSLRDSHSCVMLPESGSTVIAIRVQIENDVVTLSIDTSGSGLNKRGYRLQNNSAPLRETLAAGMIMLSRWRPKREIFYDPFCGTGTLLIEAALIAHNKAPGLNRAFAAESWNMFSADIWNSVREHAKAQIDLDSNFDIRGSDYSEKAIDYSGQNISRSELKSICLQHVELAHAKPCNQVGKIVTNPPYGSRLSTKTRVLSLYKEMGIQFSHHFPNFDYYILSDDDQFELTFGQRARKNRKLYNGGIQCRFYQFWTPRSKN